MPKGGKLQNVGTMIVDLDGTISDRSLGFCRCINHALRFYGFSEVSAELVAVEIGPPLDEAFSKFQPGADQSMVANLIAKYRERYAEIGYSENEIYPGVAGAIQTLSDRGIRMGVCTSKRKDFAEKILSMFGLLSMFSFVDGGDVGVKKIEQLSVLIQAGEIDRSAVMVGDREVDISSAKANGLRSIGVLWGFGGVKELSRAGADVILSNTSELRQLGI
jgi:phosphoglycolate phosphatase